MPLSYIPFAYAMNYTSVVDAVFAKWMSDHAADFVHELETGFYVYNGKRLSVSKLQRELWPLTVSVVFEAFDWIRTTDKSNATYYLFVVNSRWHMPDDGKNDNNSKWSFNEDADIKLNFSLFEETFQKIFDRLFKLQLKNKNQDILYIQVEDLSYETVLAGVIERLFGLSRVLDLTEKLTPKHLVDAGSIKQHSDGRNIVHSNDGDMIQSAINATLEWIERMTSLGATA